METISPTNAARPVVQLPAQGQDRWQLGMLLSFKAMGADTGGRLWALEGQAPYGAAPPLHVHTHEDEVWYVLDGEIDFTVGDDVHRLTAGAFAYVPIGIPHTFRIASETARWFGFGTPAGLDQWFIETSEPATGRTLPPPPSAPLDVDDLVASLRRYGTDTIGPPPG